MTMTKPPPEVKTFIGHRAGLLSLSRRIEQEHSGFHHALNTRHTADIAGRTGVVAKTELMARLARLETRLEDYMLVTGRWNHGGHVTRDVLLLVAAQEFGIHLGRLWKEVKAL